MLHMSGINPVLVLRLAQEQPVHQQGNLSAPLLALHKTQHVFHALNASLQSSRSDAHLCCNAHWACVGVALAHHDAAQSDQRGSSKPKLLCTQQRCNCDVTACAHLPISLLTQHMQTAASK